jgi:hypothetical protein
MSSENRDCRQCREYSYGKPGAGLARGGPSIRIVGCCQPVIFQRAAGTTVSTNLPLWRPRKNVRHPKPLRV